MHVTRQRRVPPVGLLPQRLRLRGRYVLAGATALALAGGGMAAYATTVGFGTNQVGTEYANGLQVSDDQVIKPIGDRLATNYGKLIGSTVSPDGRFLAATSADKSVVLQVFDLATYRLLWRVGTASGVDERLSDGSVGQEGPTYSPDGRFLWLPETNGLTRFPVNADGTLGAPTTIKLPKVDGASALPGKAAYSADGSTLYVPLNGQNTVVALDPATGAVRQTWNVGIAPREVAVVGAKLYVSNEGGRHATAGETTMNSYGTDVPADPVLGTSTTGTLSVIDTADPSAAVAPSRSDCTRRRST